VRRVHSHTAAGLLTLLVALCLTAAVGVATVVEGPLGVAGGVLAAAATFQLLRVPVGRTAGRLLES
jgi:hypothetical protein